MFEENYSMLEDKRHLKAEPISQRVITIPFKELVESGLLKFFENEEKLVANRIVKEISWIPNNYEIEVITRLPNDHITVIRTFLRCPDLNGFAD